MEYTQVILGYFKNDVFSENRGPHADVSVSVYPILFTARFHLVLISKFIIS